MSYYDAPERLYAPLDVLVNRWYPLPTLRWLYGMGLESLARAYPVLLPQPKAEDMSGKGKVLKKSYYAELFLAVLGHDETGRRFLEGLPGPARTVLTRLIWTKSINLDALEREVGFQISTENLDASRYYWEPYVLDPEHSLLVVFEPKTNGMSYYSQKGPPPKTAYSVALPQALRKRLKGYVSPPPGYELSPLASIPADAGMRFDCSSVAISDCRLVAEFIEQGHLKFTKSETVAMSSIRSIRAMMGGGEFFPESEDADLLFLRTRLLMNAIARAGTKERASILEASGSAEPVKAIFQARLLDAPFLHEQLLGHLDNARNRGREHHEPSVKRVRSFFSNLPSGQWVSWANIASYHQLREEHCTLFNPETNCLQATAMKPEDRWTKFVMVTEREWADLVSEPLLRAYAFLLAALGLAEVCYELPKMANYHLPGKPYLTPFDGLHYVRLTDLGDFVLGRRKSYDVDAGRTARNAVVLDEVRLLASCQDLDPLTEMALDRFLERIAVGRYRMTAKSLLKGCTSRQDLEERIRLFRRVVSERPPPVWEAFFTKTLARISPLQFEPEFVVLKLDSDEELRRHFSTDPVLKEITLKVEGLRVAVRNADLKKMAKRLEQFGYLSPMGRFKEYRGES